MIGVFRQCSITSNQPELANWECHQWTHLLKLIITSSDDQLGNLSSLNLTLTWNQHRRLTSPKQNTYHWATFSMTFFLFQQHVLAKQASSQELRLKRQFQPFRETICYEPSKSRIIEVLFYVNNMYATSCMLCCNNNLSQQSFIASESSHALQHQSRWCLNKSRKNGGSVRNSQYSRVNHFYM